MLCLECCNFVFPLSAVLRLLQSVLLLGNHLVSSDQQLLYFFFVCVIACGLRIGVLFVLRVQVEDNFGQLRNLF